MFNVKDTPYNCRDSNIVFQPQFDKIAYDKIPLNTTIPIYGTCYQLILRNLLR